jgi:hypothetical protein
VLAVDWVSVSGIATAGATLVLAVATFASVRYGNRAARIAERSLLASLRPLLVPTRPDAPDQKVGFQDDKWFRLSGGGAAAEVGEDAIYLAIAVRNAGSGIAVMHGWYVHPDRTGGADATYPPLERFRRLTRDLYVGPGEDGFWQGALRDPSDPIYPAIRAAIEEPHGMMVDILYGDSELGQRSVSRIALLPRDDGRWFATIGRHWNVDRPDPR